MRLPSFCVLSRRLLGQADEEERATIDMMLLVASMVDITRMAKL